MQKNFIESVEMTFLNRKDPTDRIKSRSFFKTDVFKKNRSMQLNLGRTIIEESDFKLMISSPVIQKDFVTLVQGRSDYIWLPHLVGSKQTIVSSADQTTRAIDLKFSFKSMLPNGSYASSDKGFGCILDTFFLNNMFWVLDVLVWKDCQLFDCEAEFRSHWLSSCLEPEMSKVALANEFSFNLLPRIDGNDKNWKNIVNDWMNNPNFDGLLAYHKHSYYISGKESNFAHSIPKNLWKLCEF